MKTILLKSPTRWTAASDIGPTGPTVAEYLADEDRLVRAVLLFAHAFGKPLVASGTTYWATEAPASLVAHSLADIVNRPAIAENTPLSDEDIELIARRCFRELSLLELLSERPPFLIHFSYDRKVVIFMQSETDALRKAQQAASESGLVLGHAAKPETVLRWYDEGLV